MPVIEPFIRWAGGKTWLVPHIAQLIGSISIEHYHEPFLGGGAVFFSLDTKKKSYLSDANPQLINTYIQVRDDPERVISFFENMPNTKDDYYRIRSEITKEPTAQNAARFIYLNQTSFNGLYRVNRQGQYNVPYGYRKREYNVGRILVASEALRNTRIEVGDFELNRNRIMKNDLVFLDPPYTVSHNNNGFIQYNQNLFSLEDQYRLKQYIDFIKRKNAYYILSNAAHEKIREIFENDNDRVIELRRNSSIGGKFAARTAVSEYIFTNIPEVHHE